MKSGPREFFEAACDLFVSAADRDSARRQDFCIGGLVCRLEVVGEGLAPRLTRAIAHLRRPTQSRKNLVIRAWETTNGRMISPPWSKDDYGPRGEIRGFNTERFATVFDQGSSSLSLFDRERATALFWTREGAKLPASEAAAPLRTIFSWGMEEKNRMLIHGAAVAREQGAALLVGPGGSGKSTTALLCLQAGWNYLADDYCLLELGERPRVFSLYNSAKIARTWLRDVPQLRNLGDSRCEMHCDKHILFLQEIIPDRLIDSAECRVLIIPEVSKERTSVLENATPAEALRALAPSSIFQSAARGQRLFQHLSELVQRIPVRRLKLGRDTNSIPQAVERCLAET